MSTQAPAVVNLALPDGARICVLAARFNAEIVDELLRGCLQRLKELGATESAVTVRRVPGAFELPSAAAMMLSHNECDAVIALGAVIRGDTPHFDFVAGECARGLMAVSIKFQRPVIFGVLTTNTEQQARDRAGGSHSHAGVNAANAAAEMLALNRSLEPEHI